MPDYLMHATRGGARNFGRWVHSLTYCEDLSSNNFVKSSFTPPYIKKIEVSLKIIILKIHNRHKNDITYHR